jgi:hypothetical protein
MGIRAVQAGALTSAIDRPLPGDHPEMEDFARAAGFRRLAQKLEVSPAVLAHRYGLSLDIDTLVPGVKNRPRAHPPSASRRRRRVRFLRSWLRASIGVSIGPRRDLCRADFSPDGRIMRAVEQAKGDGDAVDDHGHPTAFRKFLDQCHDENAAGHQEP